MNGSTSERRRLSKIFQRETVEMGLRHQLARFVGHAREHPLRNLPVAAHPAVLAARVGAVVRGIVVDQFDIADQPGARVGAFDQVVAQQGIAREALVQHRVQRGNFVDAFAGEDAFAVEILVGVGDGAAVDVEAGLAGVDGCQPRARRRLTLTPMRGCRMP